MFQLMDHQREGVAFLVENGSGLLAFEQGLGKTLVAIEAYRRLREEGKASLLLVVCPNSLKKNWQQELARFAPGLSSEIVRGTARERRERLSFTTADVVIINYEAARNEIISIQALLKRNRAVLVLDESHMAKNRSSLTSIASRHFARLAPFRWLLTGTPIPNSPEDIFAQVELVAAGSPLGSFGAFCERFADAGTSPAQQEALAEEVEPFLLRRRKEDCLDLPEKTFVDLHVPLPAWQRALYEDMRDGIVRNVRQMSREEYRRFAPTALTRLLRLSQLASNPSLLIHEEGRTPGKFREMDQVLEELVAENGRKVILWSYYVKTVEALADRYSEYGAVTLYGGTPSEERQEIAESFQQDPDVRLLVANPAAAGTGFTLTAADYAIYETLNWRYDLYAQSQDRNHRIGQAAPVTYLRLLAEDTIDEVMAEALARKGVMAANILGDEADEFSVTTMPPEAFCQMLEENKLPGGD